LIQERCALPSDIRVSASRFVSSVVFVVFLAEVYAALMFTVHAFRQGISIPEAVLAGTFLFCATMAGALLMRRAEHSPSQQDLFRPGGLAAVILWISDMHFLSIASASGSDCGLSALSRSRA